jgi:hypothetical protein
MQGKVLVGLSAVSAQAGAISRGGRGSVTGVDVLKNNKHRSGELM